MKNHVGASKAPRLFSKKQAAFDDERGLTLGEVQQLDALYCWLMNRRRDKRGYVLGTNGRE